MDALDPLGTPDTEESLQEGAGRVQPGFSPPRPVACLLAGVSALPGASSASSRPVLTAAQGHLPLCESSAGCHGGGTPQCQCVCPFRGALFFSVTVYLSFRLWLSLLSLLHSRVNSVPFEPADYPTTNSLTSSILCGRRTALHKVNRQVPCLQGPAPGETALASAGARAGGSEAPM